MRMFKKSTALLLTLVLLLASLPFATLITSAEETLYDAIYEGLMASEERIDLSAFQATPQELNDTYQRMIYEKPDLFFVNTGVSYGFERYPGEPNVIAMKPVYRFVGGELAQARRQYEGYISAIVSVLNDEWSDLQKVLVVHDLLNERYEYDNDLTIYDAYNFLKEKKGVCQSYVLTFRAVMDELGIESSWAHSANMNHLWTQVKLDGEWYNLDVTQNDVVPNRIGRAQHKRFLKSDAAMKALGYSDWTANHTCTSTRFDTDAVWDGVEAPFVCMNDSWYYLKDSELYSYDFESKQSIKLANLTYQWSAEGGGFWQGFFSGLSAYNGLLYFNSADALRSFDPVTKAEAVVFSYEEAGSIFGSYLRCDAGDTAAVLYYQVGETPNDTEVSIGQTTLHEHTWNEGTVQKAPTCKTPGEKLFTCTECQQTKTEPIAVDPDAHTWDEGIVQKAPTCKEPGEKLFTCTECQQTKTESIDIDPDAHEWEVWETITPATKDAEGLARRTCKLCGKTEEKTLEKLPDVMLGDGDGDNKITTTDARLTLQYTAGKIGEDKVNLSAVNVDTDDKVSTTDARLILQFTADKIKEFPRKAG